MKADPIKASPQIFEIEKRVFNRDFDDCPSQVEEVVEFIKDTDVYLLFEESNPIGYFALKPLSDNTCELKSIAVDAPYQGQGVGSYLMQRVLEVANDKTIQLVTHPKNVSGLFLYLKNGFEIVGWVDDYLGDGQPRLKLKRTVTETV